MPLPFPRRVPSGKGRALELNSIGCCQSLGWRNPAVAARTAIAPPWQSGLESSKGSIVSALRTRCAQLLQGAQRAALNPACTPAEHGPQNDIKSTSYASLAKPMC
jgi:hypothetical protein